MNKNEAWILITTWVVVLSSIVESQTDLLLNPCSRLYEVFDLSYLHDPSHFPHLEVGCDGSRGVWGYKWSIAHRAHGMFVLNNHLATCSRHFYPSRPVPTPLKVQEGWMLSGSFLYSGWKWIMNLWLPLQSFKQFDCLEIENRALVF